MTHDGRTIRMLTMIDEYTREYLAKDLQFEKLLRAAFNLFKRRSSSRIKAKRKKHSKAA